jgi:hypothetical protein
MSIMADNLPARVDPPVERVPGGPAEVVSAVDMVYIAYERLGFDEMLEAYALCDETGGVETRMQAALFDYAKSVASIATQDGGMDIPVIREAFDRFYEGMEGASRKKYGAEKPSSISDAALKRFGLRPPTYQRQFKPLDDRYWEKQFVEQYESGAMATRKPNESDQDYLARYIATCLHGFPWAYFTNFI